MQEDLHRKRNLDDGETDPAMPMSKRSNGSEAGDATGTSFFLKTLCPREIVGNLIGRGGAIISNIIQTTGARIKISQNNEFFPQTTDRIIAISGPKEKIAAALTEIVTRMYDGDASVSEGAAVVGTNIQKSLKILIPTNASGVIIGKSGAAIKSMSELCGCHLQLGDSSDPYQTNERVLTIASKTGNITNLIHGAHLIVAQLFSPENANQAAYSNTRTSYASTMIPHGGSHHIHHHTGAAAALLAGAGGGYSGGVMGGTYGGHGGHGVLGKGTATLSHTPTASLFSHNDSLLIGTRGVQDQGGLGDYRGGDNSSSSRGGGNNVNGGGITTGDGDNDISSPTYTALDGNTVLMQIGVPDHMVGSLLGKGGSVIKEIMAFSGTTIQVSQKDQYLPNTKQRSVRVTGSHAQVQVVLAVIAAKLSGGS